METRGGAAILGLSVTALGIVVALPILFVLLQSIFPHLAEGSLASPFGAMVHALTDRRLPEMLASTIGLGICVALGCFVVAAPLAVLRGLTDLPAAKLWDVLFLIPFMIPPYVAAFGWVMALQPGGFTTQLFGLNLGKFLFSFAGVVTVMVLHLFPVVYFALSRTLAVVGSRFADVGRVCGANMFYAFFRITLPLSMPAIAGSLLLAFALTIEEYGTPATLGRQSGLIVLVTGIEERFAEWPIDLPGAALTATILMALALAAFFLQRWLVERRSFVVVSGKHTRTAVVELGRWKLPAVLLFVAVTLLAVVGPIASIVLTSISRTLSGGLTWSNFGFQHFEAVLGNRGGAMDALTNSLWLAAAAALGAAVLGALASYVAVRSQMRGRSIVDALSVLPNAVPGMVLAVGLILAWNRSWWPFPVYNTPVVLILAYICILLPYPVRYVGAALRQIGVNLDAAARVSGAGMGLTLWRILLPLIAPNLLIATLLVFAIASRELVASVMLAPSGMKTVATFVFNQFAQGSPGMGMALSVIAIFSSTAILVVLARFTQAQLDN
jgi:iron(III) transport system permease protein